MIEFIEMKRKSRLKKDKKTNKRIDVFFVYFVYFVVFITLIQISEIEFVKIFFEEKLRMRFRFDLIGIYAPLFLSTILIDVTYRLGKRQNELVTRQTRESEYNINKTIYVSISKVTDYVLFFVKDCCFSMLNRQGCEDVMKKHDIHREMFEKCSIDCELRFTELTKCLYSFRLALMQIQIIETELYIAQMNNQIDYRKMICNTDIDSSDVILSCIQDDDIKLTLKQYFEKLRNIQEDIEHDSKEILNAIKQKMQQ